MGRSLRLLPCLALLAAAAPSRAAPASQVGLLIWYGSGHAAEDADAAIAELEASALRSSLPATRLLSTDVKGLKPGYHIAVLGACPKARAAAVLELVRAVQPAAYVRFVPLEGAVAGLQCPSVKVVMSPLPEEASEETEEHQPESPEVKHRVRAVAAGVHKLRVKLDTELDSNGEWESSSWSAVIELYRGATLVSSQQLSHGDFGQVDAFEATEDGVRLETTDLSSDCKGSETFDGAKVHRLFRIAGGKIAVDEQQEEKFGLCSPSPEGADPDTMRCMTERYQALLPSCSGGPASRERCERAIAKYDAKHGRRCF